MIFFLPRHLGSRKPIKLPTAAKHFASGPNVWVINLRLRLWLRGPKATAPGSYSKVTSLSNQSLCLGLEQQRLLEGADFIDHLLVPRLFLIGSDSPPSMRDGRDVEEAHQDAVNKSTWQVKPAGQDCQGRTCDT